MRCFVSVSLEKKNPNFSVMFFSCPRFRGSCFHVLSWYTSSFALLFFVRFIVIFYSRMPGVLLCLQVVFRSRFDVIFFCFSAVLPIFQSCFFFSRCYSFVLVFISSLCLFFYNVVHFGHIFLFLHSIVLRSVMFCPFLCRVLLSFFRHLFYFCFPSVLLVFMSSFSLCFFPFTFVFFLFFNSIVIFLVMSLPDTFLLSFALLILS